MSLIFSEAGFLALRQAIKDARDALNSATERKAESGRGQDTWHDEGAKLGTVIELTRSKRLRELQDLALEAKVAKPLEQNLTVRFGNGVLLKWDKGKQEKILLDGYSIDTQASPQKISLYSPIGQAILGGKQGEIKIVNLPDEDRKVMIKEIILPSQAEEWLILK